MSSTARARIFVPIAKIDEEKRQVWGFMAEEAPDKVGETLDYEKSKPLFEEWSQEQHKNSGGKSFGNVRAMHSKVAAGKLIHFEAQDEEKKFYVGAEVVDDVEWRKTVSGVYTGFSIGGDYVEQPTKANGFRYVARPAEVSLVDNPCMRGATFTAIKADGSSELRKFVGREVAQKWTCGLPAHEHVSKSEALACDADPDAEWERFLEKVWGSSEEEQADRLEKALDKLAARGTKAVPPKAEQVAELRKSLYSIGSLAGVLATLAFLQSDAVWEADVEGDESPMPAALAVEMEHIGELVIEMAEEEVAEAIGRVLPENETDQAATASVGGSMAGATAGLVAPAQLWTRATVMKVIGVLPAAEVSKAKDVFNRALAALEKVGPPPQEGSDMDDKALEKLLTGQTEALTKVFGDKIGAVEKKLGEHDAAIDSLAKVMQGVVKVLVPTGAAVMAVEKSKDGALVKSGSGDGADDKPLPAGEPGVHNPDLALQKMRRAIRSPQLYQPTEAGPGSSLHPGRLQ